MTEMGTSKIYKEIFLFKYVVIMQNTILNINKFQMSTFGISHKLISRNKPTDKMSHKFQVILKASS